MYTLCTHCGITLHPEMLIAFSRSRRAHKCSQDKMSSTCGMCCTMNKSTHQEIVKCLSSSTVPALEISAMGMSRCLIARRCGLRLLMAGRGSHRCFSSNGAEKEPTTKQIGKWLVGGGGSLAIVTFGWDMWRHRQEGWDMWRHRQEQERVKNIIVNASFTPHEPPVNIERKAIKATCTTFFFGCVCLCVS